ncbi:nucleotidyltransferase family protein [Candidatus Hydrogenedentota bacterium]
MTDTALTQVELDSIRSVFARYAKIERVLIFGSRAKGTASDNSDIDLAVIGISDNLQIAAIADELDELPLPYRFDVKSYDTLEHQPFRDHIDRVGVVVYEREA